MTTDTYTQRGGTNGHMHAVLDGLTPLKAILAVEREFSGWHLFYSDEGHVWAVSVRHCPYGGCGVTLDAADAEGIWREIAAEEHRQAVAAA